jgi:cytochrome c biogenesis protein CcmG/thiol:disulfide interchange protein DsbE
LAAGLAVVLPLVGLLLANLKRDPHKVASPLVGKAAPPFVLQPLDGGAAVTLASLAGQPVVLNFWATWCVPCVQEHPALQAAAQNSGDTRFFGVIYQDTPDSIRAFLRRRPSVFPSLADPNGAAAIAYGVYGVPETYFIDRKGVIVAKKLGPLTPAELRDYLAQAGAQVGP